MAMHTVQRSRIIHTATPHWSQGRGAQGKVCPKDGEQQGQSQSLQECQLSTCTHAASTATLPWKHS